MSHGVLLDTNAIIRSQLAHPITPEALSAIEVAQVQKRIFVSVVSAWEIGLLARNPGSRTGRLFGADPETWFRNVMNAPGVKPATMNYMIALNSFSLPTPIQGDPADRLLIATARAMDVPILTRDRAMLDYAALGHVQAIAC